MLNIFAEGIPEARTLDQKIFGDCEVNAACKAQLK